MRDDCADHHGGACHGQRRQPGAGSCQDRNHPDVERPEPQLRWPLRAWARVQQRLREMPARHEHRVRGRAEHQQVQRQPLRHRRHPMGQDDDGCRQQVYGHHRARDYMPDNPRPPGAHAGSRHRVMARPGSRARCYGFSRGPAWIARRSCGGPVARGSPFARPAGHRPNSAPLHSVAAGIMTPGRRPGAARAYAVPPHDRPPGPARRAGRHRQIPRGQRGSRAPGRRNGRCCPGR